METPTRSTGWMRTLSSLRAVAMTSSLTNSDTTQVSSLISTVSHRSTSSLPTRINRLIKNLFFCNLFSSCINHTTPVYARSIHCRQTRPMLEFNINPDRNDAFGFRTQTSNTQNQTNENWKRKKTIKKCCRLCSAFECQSSQCWNFFFLVSVLLATEVKPEERL